ncbi:TPA: hypothetical protein ACH3X1_007693 [Trebouxia sp. C0004]
MAAITVKREGTGDIITFDTVAEVGSAAEFISHIENVWVEGVLLKPSSTSAFTARTPEPFPHGIYTFLPKSGTGPASTPIDSSLTVADQLFAPFSEDLFSAELDIHALQNMLTQPLTTQVPVASNIFTQYCSLMPSLYRSSTTENARGLISRFDAALAQSWPTGSGSELNYAGFWDFLGFKLPEFAQQYIDCGVSCSRGVEDDSITSPKGKRDYICLVDNMLIIAGEDKTSKTQMAEADNDLIKKHVGSNRAMYGRLQYIVLIGTAGSDLKFNVMSVIPGTGLQELFPAMEVASPVNRQKALSMFINLVRWVRTVHDHRLLPKHRHSLFKSMPRPSPYPGWVLIDWELAALAGQHVFWNSTHLPPEVNAGQMPYTPACDLWQVGRIIQQHNTLSSEAMKHFANQLTSKHFELAEHALHAMPEA